jgi:hypothetical protein
MYQAVSADASLTAFATRTEGETSLLHPPSNAKTLLIEMGKKNPALGTGEAESEGFEPSIELPLYSISSAAPSTTRPALHRHDVGQMRM